MTNGIRIDFARYLVAPEYLGIRSLETAGIRSSKSVRFLTGADTYTESLLEPIQYHEYYKGIRNLVIEACINANKHGNSEDSSRFVGMNISVCNRGYLIQISDQGTAKPEDMIRKLESAWKNLVNKDSLKDLRDDSNGFYKDFMDQTDNDVKLTNNLEASLRSLINKLDEQNIRKEEYCTNFGLGSARIIAASNSREDLGISTSLYAALNRYEKKYLDIFYDNPESGGFRVNMFFKYSQ